MSAIKFYDEKNEIFGNLLVMTNGKVEIKITKDYGPRVIHCSIVGKENMFYEDTDKLPLGDKLDVFNGEILTLYGGHRLWISPEFLPSCYYPDVLPPTIETKENSVTLTSPIESYNNIQKIMYIEMDEELPIVKVNHQIKNCGPFAVEFAPWCLTMLSAGGVEIMPQTTTDCGLLPNRNLTLWSYSEMDDPRITWGKDYFILKQDANKINPFKLGYNNENGWAAYFNKNQLFMKFFEPKLDGIYPDNNCCFETFTNSKMLEMETLGELEIVVPEGIVNIQEIWEIYEEDTVPDLNSEAIKKYFEKYID